MKPERSRVDISKMTKEEREKAIRAVYDFIEKATDAGNPNRYLNRVHYIVVALKEERKWLTQWQHGTMNACIDIAKRESL